MDKGKVMLTRYLVVDAFLMILVSAIMPLSAVSALAQNGQPNLLKRDLLILGEQPQPDTGPLRRQLDHTELSPAERNHLLREIQRLNALKAIGTQPNRAVARAAATVILNFVPGHAYLAFARFAPTLSTKANGDREWICP